MDITSDTLTRLGAKLDACDLTDDEHAALVTLLVPPRPDADDDDDDDDVAGFALSVAANQSDDMRGSFRFAQVLPTLDPMGFGGVGDRRFLGSGDYGFGHDNND